MGSTTLKLKSLFAALACVVSVVNVGAARAGGVDVEPPTYAEAEAWVFGSVVKNGKLQHKSYYAWSTSQTKEYRPMVVFVRAKLGCKPPIDTSWTDDLAGDWHARMSGGPIDMELLEDRYVVAQSHMFKEAGSRGALILDVIDRGVAFAMTHQRDHWNQENGGERPNVYDHKLERYVEHYYFSLIFPDPSPDTFRTATRNIARTWIQGFGFDGREGYGNIVDPPRYLRDDIPLAEYDVRCGNTD